jgi:hypothetical protein
MLKPTRLRCESLEARDVPATYYPTTATELVAAVEAANASTEADTIELAVDTTYTLTENYYREAWESESTKPLNPGVGPTGLPAVAAAGGALTIVGNGAVIERSVAAGTPAFRLVAVETGASLTAENLTLQNGWSVYVVYSSSPSAPAQGGAVSNHGSAVLRNVTVLNSVAQSGSSISSIGPPALGGGIFSDGALTITGGDVRGNQALGGNSAKGGDGAGAAGGGVYVGGGTAHLTGVTLTGNTARGGRGGDGYTYTTRSGTYKVPAGDGGDGRGGGLFAAGGSTVLADCTVTGNRTVGGSGGNSGYRGGGAGKGGKGLGGGIYVGPGIAADWDADTNISGNTASTRGSQVFRA